MFSGRETQEVSKRVVALLIDGGSYELCAFELKLGCIGVTSMNSAGDFRFSYSAADAKILLRILLGFETLLVSGYILTHIIAPGLPWPWRLIPRFLDVDREVSIPTWFSSIQLFAAGVMVLLMVTNCVKQLKVFLVLLGLGLLFLSMDEATAVHDNIYSGAQRLKLQSLEGREYLVWMVPYLCIGVMGLTVAYRPVLFAWRNFRRESAWIAAGTAVFIGGGIEIEIFTHYLYGIAVDAKFFLAVAAEEFFEMAGVSIMLYGFMLLGIRIQSEIST